MSPRIPIRLLAAQSDQRLVALIREGHERAFEALVQRYRRPLLRYCRNMRLSEARAEDVLQQALLQAWLALARGSEVRDLKPWLYRIVHNAAVNAMRGASERPHSELTDALQARAVAVGESELERHVAVRDALGEVAALPRMQRQAIFLTAVDGQSHDEVASALGISHGALRGLLYRARSTLRSAAAALTPPPLLAWASGGAGAGGPTAERLAELTAGAGGAGMAGLILKGAAVAVTAGAVAAGATVVSHHNDTRHAADRASVAARAGASASVGGADSSVGGATPKIGMVGGSKSVRQRRRGRRSRGGAGSGRRGRHEHRGSAEARLLGLGSGDGLRQTGTRHGSGSDIQVSDKTGGGSSGGSGSRDSAVSSDGGGGSAQTSSDGSSGDGSGVATTGSSGGGAGGGSGSQSGSDGGGSAQTATTETQTATTETQPRGDQSSTTSDGSIVTPDG